MGLRTKTQPQLIGGNQVKPKLRMVLAGLGFMGQHHWRHLRQHPQIELVGLCDQNPAPHKYHEPHQDWELPIAQDLEELLDRVQPDAVVLALPTFLHLQATQACIARGIAVLVEKPVAANAEEARELLRLEAQSQVPIAVGYIERFNPVVQALMRELAGKEIFSVQITRVGPIPPRIDDVGVLTDLSVHDIDLVRMITGREILRASAHKSHKIHRKHEDNAVLAMTLEGDLVASLHTDWLTPFKKRRIEVATAEAYYEADLITQQLIESSAYQLNNSYVRRDCFVAKSEPLAAEIDAFVRFVQTGERGSLASVADSLRTLEIIAHEH